MKYLLPGPLALTVIPLRRCNLKCCYCQISKVKKDELKWYQWVDVIQFLCEKFPTVCFVCLLGGEITLWGKDFFRFVKLMNERVKVFWNFTSNGIVINERWLRKLKSCGMDTLSLSYDGKGLQDEGQRKKSQKVLDLLKIIKKLKFVEPHITITVDKENIFQLPSIVEFFTQEGFWLEVTPLIFGKTNHYDYAASFNLLEWRFEVSKSILEKVFNKLIEMKEKGFYIHNTKEYLRQFPNYFHLQDWQCEYPVNLVVDCDGTMRLCLHIPGEKVRKYDIFENREFDFNQFLKDWKRDFYLYCRGCFWNCQYEPLYIYCRTGSLEEVKDYFRHRTRL